MNFLLDLNFNFNQIVDSHIKSGLATPPYDVILEQKKFCANTKSEFF